MKCSFCGRRDSEVDKLVAGPIKIRGCVATSATDVRGRRLKSWNAIPATISRTMQRRHLPAGQ